MTARVLSVFGGQDGIRWGDIRFGLVTRRWQLDRLTGTVTLWDVDLEHTRSTLAQADTDPERVRAARLAIAEALAVGGGVAPHR